jgi:hypothetical protein
MVCYGIFVLRKHAIHKKTCHAIGACIINYLSLLSVRVELDLGRLKQLTIEVSKTNLKTL